MLMYEVWSLGLKPFEDKVRNLMSYIRKRLVCMRVKIAWLPRLTALFVALLNLSTHSPFSSLRW